MTSLYKFVNASPSRVPFSDWYWTKDSIVKGFKARPVNNIFFIYNLINKYSRL